MTAVITHSVVSGAAANPDVDVDGAAWDANHVITGVMTPAQGGTGVVNNDTSTITISGSFGLTFTLTATTSLTLPTTGTLATLTGTEALTNKTYNGNTWTAGTGTLTLGAGKTATISNTLTFTGTDASSVAFGTGGTVLYSGGALGTPSSGTLTNCTGLPLSTGITGTGTGVLTALAINVGSAGAFVTFNGALGTPSSGTATNITGLPLSTGITGAGTGVLTALAVNVGSAGAFVTFNGALGTPSSGTLTNATGLPVASGISGFGTGIATALAVNTGSAGAPVLFNGALGTPSSGTATNLTGLPVSSGISGLGTGVATFLATPSSANLRAALTDEVGTGVAYFVNGALGTPASGTATNLTGLPISTGVSGLGTGIATALAVNTGSAGAPVLFNGAGGTPSSITLTNASGTAASLTAGSATTTNQINSVDQTVAWSTYTPTVTATSGTFTSVSATGRYRLIGKTVHLEIYVTITTAGTAAGQVKCTLPVNSAAFNYVGVSKESALTGRSGAAQILGGADATIVQGIDYNGTTFIASGGTVNFGITYEAA